jgi:hypothetical protein
MPLYGTDRMNEVMSKYDLLTCPHSCMLLGLAEEEGESAAEHQLLMQSLQEQVAEHCVSRHDANTSRRACSSSKTGN